MKSKSTWKFQTYIETYNYKLVGDKNYLNKISNFIIKRIKYCQNIEWLSDDFGAYMKEYLNSG